MESLRRNINNNNNFVYVFTPNGLFLTINIDSTTTFYDLKEYVFNETSNLPLFGLLKQDRNSYIFVYINSNTSQVEQLNDENTFIINVNSFSSTFKLTETTSNQIDGEISVKIGQVIGKRLDEFDGLKNSEVNNCRWRLSKLINEKLFLQFNIISYFYPERITFKDHNIKFIRNIFLDETFDIKIWNDNLTDNIILKVSFSYTVSHLIGDIINLPQFESLSKLPSDSFALRILGSNELIYNDNLLINYTYIQNTLLKQSIPSLIIEEKESILSKIQSINNYSSGKSVENNHLTKSQIYKSNVKYTVDCEDKFSCKIVKLTNLTSLEGLTVSIKGGLFHGNESLTDSIVTQQVKVDQLDNCDINFDFNFNIEICNLTQVSKLCLAVIDTKSNRVTHWMNVTLFDYRNRLKTGTYELAMRQVSKGLDLVEELNFEGTTQLNPHREDSMCLTIIFGTEGFSLESLQFSQEQFVVPDSIVFKERSKVTTWSEKQEKHDMCQLTTICQTIFSHELAEEDKELFRSRRIECSKFLPESLPLVLSSVKWNDRSDVQQMMQVLASWPIVNSSTALALLDSRFPSIEVRTFALQCLSQLSLDEIELLLLPIIQSARSECFLFSPTIQFLFKLALENRFMGHRIFWLLRCEMQEESISIPFGLLLESYLRFDSSYINSLLRSIEFTRKLNSISDSIRLENTVNESKKESKVRRSKFLSDIFKQPNVQELLNGLQCWFDPFVQFKNIDSSKCKIMDSKMKPLCLTFNTYNDYQVENNSICLIFKKGDDLRQDLLTIILIKLIDQIWKENGYNFYLEPYSCVPLDKKVGIIQVVKKSFTIANIQKDKGLKATSAFRKESLFQWLNNQNESEDEMAKAVEKFSLSCAGYCVISFILGIADRHSDNIMVKTDGQLFHIDFGHILGKFKAKFGIKRERVPFVLTQDFVYVITNGDKESSNFQKFQSNCEQAFLIIRRKSDLIYNIFTLMLQSGLEEVNSKTDLEYLKETLVSDLCEQEALKFFRRKFDEAFKNGWKTNLNWFAHNLAKDNP